MHVRTCAIAAVLSLVGTAVHAQWEGYQNSPQVRIARHYSSYQDYASGTREMQQTEGVAKVEENPSEYRISRGYADYAYRYLDQYYWRPCGPSCCEPLPRHCCSPNCWTLWDAMKTLTDECLYGVLDPCCEQAPACCHGCRRRSMGLLTLFGKHGGDGNGHGSGCNCGRGYGGCPTCGGGYYVGQGEDLRPVPMPHSTLPDAVPAPPAAPEATSPTAQLPRFTPQATRNARRPQPPAGPST